MWPVQHCDLHGNTLQSAPAVGQKSRQLQLKTLCRSLTRHLEALTCRDDNTDTQSAVCNVLRCNTSAPAQHSKHASLKTGDLSSHRHKHSLLTARGAFDSTQSAMVGVPCCLCRAVGDLDRQVRCISRVGGERRFIGRVGDGLD